MPTGSAVRLQLAEQLGELRLARAEGGDAAGLDVAGVVDGLRAARRSAAARGSRSSAAFSPSEA